MIFKEFHNNCVDKNNNKITILSKTKIKTVISAVFFCEFIYSIKKIVLEQNTINGRETYARFLYFEWAG